MLRLFNRVREDQPWLPWNGQDADGEAIRELQDVSGLVEGVHRLMATFRAVGPPIRLRKTTITQGKTTIVQDADTLLSGDYESFLATMRRIYDGPARRKEEETTEAVRLEIIRQRLLPFPEDNPEEL